MTKTEHWKKQVRRDNEREILGLLKKHVELRNIDIKEKMREKGIALSDPTLAAHIRNLEKDGRIGHFSKPQGDRREKWYKIKSERMEEVEGELNKYEAIKFIESIPNPVHVFKASKDGNKAIAGFMSLPGQESVPESTRQFIRRSLEIAIQALFASNLRAILPFQKIIPKKGYRQALVIMVKND